LTSQSHDVCGAEYTRWAGDRMAPLDRLEDYHNFTWGGIGYQHLDAAQKGGKAVLDAAVGQVSKQIGSKIEMRGQQVATVFNPSGWERTGVTATGKIYPLPERTTSVQVKDCSGRVVSSQIIKSAADKDGNLIAAEVAFLAEKVPSVGYDTYYLEFTPTAVPAAITDLKIDELNLALENRYLKIQLNPKTGAITSLVDKKTGGEMLDGKLGSFPVFTGKPNPNFPLRAVFVANKYPKEDMAIPDLFDSSKSVARLVPNEKEGPSSDVVDWRAISTSEIRWTEKGPLRATVRAQHNWPLLKFETYVTLYAGLPCVEVTSRVLSEIPPAPDAMESTMRFPTEIKNGYWLSFAPGFQPISLVRDFPFGVEPAERHYFHALTFVDLVGKDAGLLVLHPGTQYFKRDSNGVISNLLMREWESFWVGEYGWPRYAEYRHILMPHGLDFTNSDRLRASAETTQKLMTVVGKPQSGTLPKRKGFVSVGPESVLLSAFRKKNDLQYELRVAETEGREAESSVELAIPMSGVAETNLLGNKVAEVSRSGSKLNFKIQPWKIRTFELT
jgi:alpha-mannosidase